MNSLLTIASATPPILHIRSSCQPGLRIDDLKLYRTKRCCLPMVTISCSSSPRVPEEQQATTTSKKQQEKRPSPSPSPEPSSSNDFAEFKPVLPALLPLTPKDLAPDLPFQYWYSYSDLPPDAPKRRLKSNTSGATSVETGNASVRTPTLREGQDSSRGRGRLWQAVISTEDPQNPHTSVSDSPSRTSSRTRILSPELERKLEKAAAREEEEEGGEEEALLSDQDLKELIGTCHGSSRQINIGWEGWRPTYVGLVHTYWKRSRVCKIKCKGVVTLNMDAMCNQLERQTGGKVIGRVGGTVYLFRGMSYKHWRDAREHSVGRDRSPTTPFPKQRHSAKATGSKLGKEKLNALRARGRDIPALRKLGKNGVYLTLLDEVSKAFSTNDLVRLDCKELHPKNFKTLGFALEALVPCELISFEREHILMRRTSGPANGSHPSKTIAQHI